MCVRAPVSPLRGRQRVGERSSTPEEFSCYNALKWQTLLFSTAARPHSPLHPLTMPSARFNHARLDSSFSNELFALLLILFGQLLQEAVYCHISQSQVYTLPALTMHCGSARFVNAVLAHTVTKQPDV
ncbi:hypothetical protein J6590_008035 [Homalodisca vitripennis]|nr:hypothetical protein J6590_008035 [Homalodisca vitripennis]